MSIPQPRYKHAPPKYKSVTLHLNQLYWKPAEEFQKFLTPWAQLWVHCKVNLVCGVNLDLWNMNKIVVEGIDWYLNWVREGRGDICLDLTNGMYGGSVLEHAVCISIVLISSVCGLGTWLNQSGRWPPLRFNCFRLYGQAYENDSSHYSSIGGLAFCNGRGSFESNPIKIKLTVTARFSPWPPLIAGLLWAKFIKATFDSEAWLEIDLL